MKNQEERPFVRLPQGGRKMYTDGKNPTFEDYGASDFTLDIGFVLAFGLIAAIMVTVIIFVLWK